MTIFATVFKYGVADSICSKHKTFYAAERAATKCEKRGGANHDIWEIRIYNRIYKPKRPIPAARRED